MSKTKWVIIEEYVYGDDNCCRIVDSQLFGEYEKAKARFDQLVADQKRDDDYLNCPEDCIVDEPMEFSYYEDGNYNDNHYYLSLTAVIED